MRQQKNPSSIGGRVRNLRKKRGWTQEDLCAEIAMEVKGSESSLSVRWLSKIETDRSLPSLETIAVIAKVLQATPEEIAWGSTLPPDDYVKLKHKILRSSVYNDPQRIQQYKMT